MAIQTTLVLIKPDGVQRRIVGDVLSRIEHKGLALVAMKMVKASEEIARAHYEPHADKPFFPGLIRFVTSSPLVALAVRGESAIEVVRTLMGATDSRKAAPGTIRGDYGTSISANLVHGSDSEESAHRELALWFGDDLIDWEPCHGPWLDA